MTKGKLSMFFVSVILMSVVWFFLPALIYAAEGAPTKAEADWAGLAYLSAGLAVGIACIASSYAVARIGSAAIGALSEKPELMGKTLVFLGLAEGIAIYGVIVSLLILGKL